MDTFLWYVLLGVVYAVLWLLVIVCSCVDKHVRAVAQAQVPAGAAGGGAAAAGQEQQQPAAGAAAGGQAAQVPAGAAGAGGAPPGQA
jgi:Na+-transporting methylmalonyl-CoA/oxaloacetate decarboxylase gamma subunit